YGSQSPLNNTLSQTHSVTLTGLTIGTLYNFEVMSATGGGILATPPHYTFTTTASGPAPVISAVTATNITSTSATITWTTDLPSNSQVSFGTTPAYSSQTALDNTMVTSHSVILTGLTPSTTY